MIDTISEPGSWDRAFARGIFAAIVLLFCGAILAMGREPFDDAEDDHAQWLGADAGFSTHGRNT